MGGTTHDVPTTVLVSDRHSVRNQDVIQNATPGNTELQTVADASSVQIHHFQGDESEDICLLGCPSERRDLDDAGSKHLWNVGQFLPDYMAQHPRRHASPTLSECVIGWVPRISQSVASHNAVQVARCRGQYRDVLKLIRWLVQRSPLTWTRLWHPCQIRPRTSTRPTARHHFFCRYASYCCREKWLCLVDWEASCHQQHAGRVIVRAVLIASKLP
jgi:hypothetical protein